MPDAPSPSPPLSGDQRRLMREHLRLVYLQLNRQPGLVRHASVSGREPDDLFQEGCLALADAVRRHCPRRHGDFAPYALARIHAAMSLWLRERRPVIRIPIATQRRRRAARLRDPRIPPPRRRSARTNLERLDPRRIRLHRVRRGAHAEDNPHAVTLGELVRDRLDRALRDALHAELAAPHRRDNASTVACRVAAERLAIPDPDAQTSIRTLMAELGVSAGRITHVQARLADGARRWLKRDLAFRYLRRLARRSPDGFDCVPDPAQRAYCNRAQARSARLAHPPTSDGCCNSPAEI